MSERDAEKGLHEKVSEAAAALERVAPEPPVVGVVLGSGLGGVAGKVSGRREIPYERVPHFPPSRVAGHGGAVVFGRMDATPVALLVGRVHFYEGHPLDLVTLPVRVLAALGARAIVLTNAAGGIRSDLRPGDFLVIADHLNLVGASPLRGPADERLGARFLDCSTLYDPAFQEIARAAAARAHVELRRGVYAAMPGPQYETPAEIRMLRTLGADAVGMSTAPEAIVAVHAGMRVLGISVITNPAAGISRHPLSHEEVLEVGERAEEALARFLAELVPEVGAAVGESRVKRPAAARESPRAAPAAAIRRSRSPGARRG
jgi:purine-nucleoside phosphorylase